MTPSSQNCAADLLDVVPLIMRAMRAEVRRHRAPELSMPQFRALAFLGRNEGAALSDVAAFLGLALPSASKLIDGLVVGRLVTRVVAPEDRRRVHLALSRAGHTRYELILTQARAFLSGKMAHFSERQCRQLSATLAVLRRTFESHVPVELARKLHRIGRPAQPTNGKRKRVLHKNSNHA